MYKCIDGVPYFSSDYVLSREKEVDRLKKVEKEHQRINGELREENKRLYEELETKRHDKYITDLITENGVICMKNKEIQELRVENTELKNEVERKAKVINDLLKRVASLEYEVEKLGEKNEATD